MRSLPRPIYHNNNDSDLAYIPRELDYAQITAPVTGITATTEGTAVSVITGNSITYDGTRLRVEFFVPGCYSTGASVNPTFVLLRDTTVLAQFPAPTTLGTTAASPASPSPESIFDTPTAAAHTYKLAVFTNAGTLNVAAGAGGSGNIAPAYLRVIIAKQ